MVFLAVWLKLPCIYSQDKPNAESEFLRIRSIAFNGDHQKAEAEARKLVNDYPSYGDARILLARIMAWQKDYDKASATLDTLLSTDPGNNDALLLKNDIERWSAVQDSVDTQVFAGYSFDSFKDPYSRFWQVFKAGASHDFAWGKGSASLNAGRIITGDPFPVKANDFQAEAEAYPKLSSRNYAYLSYAISPGSYFPRHRAAAEIWQILPHSWAASLGLTYYYFSRNIFIAGASVEKYAGRYWLSAKGFVYFKDIGPTTSAYINARRYFNDDDYLQVTIGSGTAPDEPFDIRSDLMRLSASSFRITYNDKLKNKITFRIGAGYSKEEYAESGWRNRFEGHVTVSYPIMKK
jgi:YaiO family outer membrane protein